MISSSAFAQGADIEWETLNQEIFSLYSKGQYDRALVAAKKALEVAGKNVGANHPDVATVLENLADLYRKTQRDKEAQALEQRAARIRWIQR